MDTFRVLRQFFGSMPDLSARQYMVLIAVHDSKGAFDLDSTAKALGTAKPSITRHMDQLANAGLIKRELYPQDRRRITATLTPAGYETLAKASESLINAMKQEA